MKLAVRILSYFVALAIGVLAGRVWGTINDNSQLWDQVAQRDSGEVETHVHALSQLRLGRVDSAIEFLEMPLDNQVQMIAFGESKTLNLNPKNMTPTSLKALQLAKAYRSLYPSVQTSTDTPTKQIFAQVPDITFPAKCEGALCTLLNNKKSQTSNEKPQ